MRGSLRSEVASAASSLLEAILKTAKYYKWRWDAMSSQWNILGFIPPSIVRVGRLCIILLKGPATSIVGRVECVCPTKLALRQLLVPENGLRKRQSRLRKKFREIAQHRNNSWNWNHFSLVFPHFLWNGLVSRNFFQIIKGPNLTRYVKSLWSVRTYISYLLPSVPLLNTV